MAHSVSARKRIRHNKTHRARNIWRLRAMRRAIKDFDRSIGGEGDKTATFRKACAIIDRTAQKGVIHRNQAARRKSRMNARLKAAS